MHIILLTGDSARRVWPLTESNYAKLYSPLLEGPDGELESLLQRHWRLIEEAGYKEQTKILTCRQMSDRVKGQTEKHVELIEGPERCALFPSVLLASAYLYSVACADLDETAVILPVSIYAGSELYSWIGSLPEQLQASGSKLLIGSASNEENSFIKQVRLFKPGEVFAFQLNWIKSLLQESGMPVHFSELYAQYGRLVRSDLEEEVLRRKELRSFVYLEGMWKDLSSWNELSKKLIFHQLRTVI